jgi:hypothetical protein
MATITVEAKPSVIVLGNEKGGSGKSTTCIHIIVSLLREGYRVGAMDLDARQGTLAGTLAARKHFVETKNVPLPLPAFRAVRWTTSRKQRRKSASALMPRSRNCPPMPISSSSIVPALTPICPATATPMPIR